MRSAAKTWARIAVDQRHQRCRRRAHPVGQRRDVEIDAFPGIDGALPVERQMQAVLGEQDMGEQLRARAPARDRVRWRRRLADRFAGPAGELLAHVLDHLPLARNELQRLGHVLADLAQCRRRRSTGRPRAPDRRSARAADARAADGAPAGAVRTTAPSSSRSSPRLPSGPPPPLAPHPPPNRRVEARADRAAHHVPRIARTARAAAS